MFKKRKPSTKLQALADSLIAIRARLERSCNAPPTTADSQALWDSAPIVLKHLELQCEAVELALAHRQPLMILTATDRFSGLIHFEIHRRASMPTVEACVRRAESAFACLPWSKYLRAGLRIPAAAIPTRKSRPTASPGPTLMIGCTGTGKSGVPRKLIQRFPRLDRE